ncbi:TPA: DUF2070 family protein [Candidatus Micrarchaeota archaeon]|nr:DUF2070 family protein [Candidatus Micrarchaeota archaeon]
MQQVKKDALVLAKYFLSLPHPAKTCFMILAVSFLFGILFGLAKARQMGPFELFAAGIDGFFVLAFPALLSSACLFLMRRKAIFRRSAFLGLLSAAVYGAFYLASFALSTMGSWAYNIVFVGFAFAFGLWYFTLLLAFDFRRSAFLFATMQMVFFAVFFLARGGFSAGEDFQAALIKIYFASFLLLAALYSLFYFISMPMKKNLGISSLDALSMFASQWLYGGKDLEEAFEEIGEEVETLVWLAAFKGKENSAIFVVPYIHYGPFGNLGGSEFTSMIGSSLSRHGNAKNDVFVFHGTATHDFNPVSSEEIHKVVGACEKALKRLKPASSELSFASCRVGSVRAQAYRINDSAFVSYSRAPLTTEDVNMGLGLALMEKAKKYCSSACAVDEHNAETGDISSVEVGSPIAFEMLDATEKLFQSGSKAAPFRFGCASAYPAVDTIGKNGLKLALFSQGKKMNALLLADSNGIVPEFRTELIGLMANLGREQGFICKGEVMTSDTHQINTVRGVLNPLGVAQKGDVMMAVRKLFGQAAKKLEEVKFDSAEERFRIKVFGTGQSAEIASTINAAVSILRVALPIILIASALLLLWALGKI